MVKSGKVTSKYVWELLAEAGLDVFRPADVSNILGVPMSVAYRKAAELVNIGFARNVRHGLYVLVDMKDRTPHPFVVASQAVIPSYVSYLTALNHHGFSEQVPRVVQMASTVKAGVFSYENMRTEYHMLHPRKFYGYETRTVEREGWAAALPEKAVIDSFDNPCLVGGLEEAVDILVRSSRDIDARVMTGLLKIFPSRATISRIGCVLDRMGKDVSALQKYASTTPIYLIPKKEGDVDMDRGWNVYIGKGVLE